MADLGPWERKGARQVKPSLDVRDVLTDLARQRRLRRWRASAPYIVVGLAATPLFYLLLPALETQPGSDASRQSALSAPATQFSLCHSGGGRNCVVDGDTFWMDGEKIRIADIDTPETHPPRCQAEAELGEAATRRLQALLNEGPIELAQVDRDRDRYGRKLRIVERGGTSLGDVLVEEGLARSYSGGPRRGWCGDA